MWSEEIKQGQYEIWMKKYSKEGQIGDVDLYGVCGLSFEKTREIIAIERRKESFFWISKENLKSEIFGQDFN